MPSFTVKIGNDGPVVDAQVWISEGRAAVLADKRIDSPKKIKIRALLDTGASCTCIDSEIIQQLGLGEIAIKGKSVVNTPLTGELQHEVDEYDVSFTVPHPDGDNTAPFKIDTVRVVETKLNKNQGIQALIGRDILRLCLLCYNGQDSTLIFSY